MKNRVFVSKTPDDAAEIGKTIFDLLQTFCADKNSQKINRVFIKPNFIWDVPAKLGATTDLRVLGAIVDFFKQQGAKEIFIGDGSGEGMTARVFEKLNVWELEKKGARVINFENEELATVKSPLGKILQELHIPKIINDCDLIVCAAKLKTHHSTKVSLCVKNFFGTIPFNQRLEGHKQGLDEAIVDVFSYFQKNKKIICLVDGIYAMEGAGSPTHGTPVKMGLLVAGDSCVSTDAACCKIMGVNPQEVKHLSLALEKGLGDFSFENKGLSIQTVARKFEIPESKLAFGLRRKIAQEKELPQKPKALILFLNPPTVSFRSLFCIGPAKAAHAASLDKPVSNFVDLGVEIVDANALSTESFAEKIAEKKPAYVCMMFYERCAKEIESMIKLVKKNSPQTKAIITGPFASFFPQEAFLASGADILLRGECEKTLPQFLRAAFDQNADKGSLDEIPGLYMAKNVKIYSFKKSGEIPILSPSELDSLHQDWSIVKKFEDEYGIDEKILLTSSRGCSGKCFFCGKNYKRIFRAETPLATANKVETALIAFPEKKMVEFNDDSFLEDKTRVLELAKIFSKRGISKRTAITIQARVDNFFVKCAEGEREIDWELMAALKELNLKGCYLGIESLSKKELARYGKGEYSKEDVFELYDALEKIGVTFIVAYLILSNMDTEPEDLIETLDGMEQLYLKHSEVFGVEVSPFLLLLKNTPQKGIREEQGDLEFTQGVAEMPKNEIVKKSLLELGDVMNGWKREKENWDDRHLRKKLGIKIIRMARLLLEKNWKPGVQKR